MKTHLITKFNWSRRTCICTFNSCVSDGFGGLLKIISENLHPMTAPMIQRLKAKFSIRHLAKIKIILVYYYLEVF